MRSLHRWHKGVTIGEVLHNKAKEFPGHTAMVTGDIRMSYADLDHEVDRVAKALLSFDIVKGDHVAIMASNIPEWILLEMATLRIGVVLVPINPSSSLDFLRYALNQCDIKALFVMDRFKSASLVSLVNKICTQTADSSSGELNCVKAPALKMLVSIRGAPLSDILTWKTFLESSKRTPNAILHSAESNILDTDIGMIQYTSWSTGVPKPVILTQGGLLLNAMHSMERMKVTYKDRVCIAVPFYDGFGCGSGILGSIVQGATIINYTDVFDPISTLSIIEKEEVTFILGFPKIFTEIMKKWNNVSYSDTSLRTGVVMGDMLPVKLLRAVINDLGAREITVAYGLTEASPIVTQTHANDSNNIKFDTVGKPLPDEEIKIIDISSYKILPAGKIGELCVRGSMVMLGYYKTEKDIDTFIDNEGWLHTGDLAMLRDDGNYQIIGRKSDTVRINERDIFPGEIERVLLTHPDIEDVVVIGVPDLLKGGKIFAVIRLHHRSKISKDDIMEFCKTKMASHNMPEDVFFRDDMPMTSVGKIQRFKVKEWVLNKLELSTVHQT